MSVKRYALEHERGESNTFGCPDGDYVLFKDYAALEARCAGLERERDALKEELDLQSPHRIRMHNDLIGSQAMLEDSIKERDALQAKLAAAEEALREIRDKHSMDNEGAGSFIVQVNELEDIARAALAGHAPATKGEGDE